MKVAAVQFASTEVVDDNCATLARFFSEAASQGVRLVVCPEASQRAFGRPGETLAPNAEELNGTFVSFLRTEAAANGLVIVAGMFEKNGDQLPFNTTVVVGPGGLLGVYRKIHLYDAFSFVESAGISPGSTDASNIVTVQVDGWTIGVQTCFDLRFPEMSRALIDAGADVLVLGAAWVVGSLKAMQFEHLCATRAIESTTYLIAAGQPRPRFCGISRIIEPSGELAAVGNADDEKLLVADLSHELLDEVRSQMPLLEARRLSQSSL